METDDPFAHPAAAGHSPRGPDLLEKITRPVRAFCSSPSRLTMGGQSVRNVRQQGHEPRLLDRQRHGMLAGGGATALAAADDLALAVRQLREQFRSL